MADNENVTNEYAISSDHDDTYLDDKDSATAVSLDPVTITSQIDIDGDDNHNVENEEVRIENDEGASKVRFFVM